MCVTWISYFDFKKLGGTAVNWLTPWILQIRAQNLNHQIDFNSLATHTWQKSLLLIRGVFWDVGTVL